MHLIYATYQYFPDTRTNIFNLFQPLKNFKPGLLVDLIYPDRKISNNIDNFYNIDKEFNKIKVRHLQKYISKRQFT